MTGRERIVAQLEGRAVDRVPLMPITMQFACDQIGAKYLDYSTDYRVLVEGQLRTAERFDFDYVNTMSDPAREAADCGAIIRYFDHQPAAMVEDQALLGMKSKLIGLKIPDPLGGGRMYNGIKALELYKQQLAGEKWIEGWIEGPCAEGADLRGINNLMLDFYDDPAFVHDLFGFVVEMELRFACAQVAAGADAIGIGDAAASLVSQETYEEFIWPYEKRMVDGVHALGAKVRLHICGDTRHLLEGIGRLGCDFVDLDSITPLADARAALGEKPILLGNMNPVSIVRNGNPETIRAAVRDCRRQAGPRYSIGAGCEIPRDTPLANLQALTDFARSALPQDLCARNSRCNAACSPILS